MGVMGWPCGCDDKLEKNVGWPVIWMTLNKWARHLCKFRACWMAPRHNACVCICRETGVRLNLPVRQLQSGMNNAFSTTESLRSIEQHHSCGYVLQSRHLISCRFSFPSLLFFKCCPPLSTSLFLFPPHLEFCQHINKKSWPQNCSKKKYIYFWHCYSVEWLPGHSYCNTMCKVFLRVFIAVSRVFANRHNLKQPPCV